MPLLKPKLKKPVVYASVDEWGYILNDDLDSLDLFHEELLKDLQVKETAIRNLENNKIDKSEVDTIIGEKVDNYIEINVKPELDSYVNDLKKPELDTYTLIKKQELDSYTNDIKKLEIDVYTQQKKGELDTYTNSKKEILDTYTLTKKQELDSYEKIKEDELNLFTTDKKSEITTHTDTEIERIHATGIDKKLDKGKFVGDAGDLDAAIKAIYNTGIMAGNGLSGGGAIKDSPVLNIVSDDEGIIINENSIKLNVVNDLTSGGTNKAASAETVKILKQLIDAIGAGGVQKLLKHARALGGMDYIGILNGSTKIISVGTQLFAPKLYLDGIFIDKNEYVVELSTGLITLNQPYSFYDVTWVVEDNYPYHIKFSFPTLNLLLSSEQILNDIDFGDVIEILGENDADDGDHRLVKCENSKKLNWVEIGVGKYLNEIPNTRISTIVDNKYQIKYKHIGNTITSIDLLEWALSASTGFYRSQNNDNLFSGLPKNLTKGAFKLEIGSITENTKRTLKLTFSDSNDIWINTNTSNSQSGWLGWTLLINDSNPKNVIYRKTIENKEQFDAINFNENGIYYIKNFNTIFPNNGIKPTPFNYGYLEVMTHTSNEAFLTYTPYKILDGAKLVARVNNGILENWTYENNFQASNKGSVSMYGVGDGTDNKISFYDYKTGTVNCSVFDGTAHVNYNGVVIKNDKANTYFTLENDKNISFTVNNNKMSIMLNPFIYKNEYTYITGSQNTINKAGIRGGIEHWYVDGDGGGKPIGTPTGTSHIISTYTASPDWWIQTAMDFQSGQIQTRVSNGNSNSPTDWATLFSTENCKLINLNGGNGYVIFPNGLILQFGRVALTPNNNNYVYVGNYHVPFKVFSNVYCTRSYSYHSPASLFMVCWEKGLNQFQIHMSTNQLGQADTYYWFAIGI